MIYTAALRDSLIRCFTQEAYAADWSPCFVFEHVHALVTTPLGTSLDVDVAEADDSVGQDMHTHERLGQPADDGRDVERVAFQRTLLPQ